MRAPPDPTITSTPEPAPAEVIDRGDLACPLCEYSLRGLTDPRCPECGYAFDWDELTHPERRLHPYLFEHHPERNAWSWRSTLLGGLRPRRFWRDLHPAQPSRPRRLALYALLCALALGATVLARVAVTAYRMDAEYQTERRLLATSLRRAVVTDMSGRRRTLTPAEVQAHVEQSWPPLFFGAFAERVTWDRDVRWARRSAAALLAWPVLTLATLMIFRQSMARARVRTAHVARCVVYSADVIVWSGLATLALLAADVALHGTDRSFGRSYVELAARLVWSAAFFVAAYRLAVAYALYLRMDRPVLTILAAQVIVCLVLLLLAVEVTPLVQGWGWAQWVW